MEILFQQSLNISNRRSALRRSATLRIFSRISGNLILGESRASDIPAEVQHHYLPTPDDIDNRKMYTGERQSIKGRRAAGYSMHWYRLEFNLLLARHVGGIENFPKRMNGGKQIDVMGTCHPSLFPTKPILLRG